MASLRDIKRRISSVKNTQQITNAMKMIAAAKLARAQMAAQSAQAYAERMRGMVTKLAQGVTGDDHPLFEAREGGIGLVVMFTSDRGLCGGFNNNLSRRGFQVARFRRTVIGYHLAAGNQRPQNRYARRSRGIGKTAAGSNEPHCR